MWKPIPGETPIDDVSELKDKSIATRGQLNVAEARNISKVTIKYLSAVPSDRLAPFTYSWVLQLHGEMFSDVWGWAGVLRTTQTNLGVAPLQIQSMLFDLVQNRLPEWKEVRPIEQTTMLHHQSVFIHPFKNGNGRWSRMLANIWLLKQAGAYVEWPEQSVGDESTIRQEYISAIQAADVSNYAPLIELHEKYMVSV